MVFCKWAQFGMVVSADNPRGISYAPGQPTAESAIANAVVKEEMTGSGKASFRSQPAEMLIRFASAEQLA